MPSATLETLSRCLMLGTLLSEVRRRWGAYELLDHWQQGEFHHDIVLRACALLLPDTRSELREEYRERQCGGGWLPRKTTS